MLWELVLIYLKRYCEGNLLLFVDFDVDVLLGFRIYLIKYVWIKLDKLFFLNIILCYFNKVRVVLNKVFYEGIICWNFVNEVKSIKIE